MYAPFHRRTWACKRESAATSAAGTLPERYMAAVQVFSQRSTIGMRNAPSASSKKTRCCSSSSNAATRSARAASVQASVVVVGVSASMRLEG